MIKVLVVDDSAMVRKLLSEELGKASGIEVVGNAVDPYIARDKIIQLNPDVVTLDIEMPRMDGLSFLMKLMQYHPLPVVIVSSLTSKNNEIAMKALELGAIAVVKKPSQFSIPENSIELINTIRAAAQSNLSVASQRLSLPIQIPKNPLAVSNIRFETTHKIVAIGASTGGTQAIEAILSQLPADTPGTVIVQHIPHGFSASFANRLNEICRMEVREAVDGDPVVPGVALVAPGGIHMVLQKNGGHYHVRLKDGPHVHYQKPSVDALFQSVARVAGENAVAALLTGMGSDGAEGLLILKNEGAFTIAQDENTCVVFGMPREAIRLGAACSILGLDDIPQGILGALSMEPREETGNSRINQSK